MERMDENYFNYFQQVLIVRHEFYVECMKLPFLISFDPCSELILVNSIFFQAGVGDIPNWDRRMGTNGDSDPSYEEDLETCRMPSQSHWRRFNITGAFHQCIAAIKEVKLRFWVNSLNAKGNLCLLSELRFKL